MGGANRIATHFAQNLELALSGSEIESRSECAEVMVLIDTLNFDEFTINKNPGIRLETQ